MMDFPGTAESSTGAERNEKRRRRTKSGCLTCRRRKIKCDEEKPHCGRCVASNKPCNYPPPYAYANIKSDAPIASTSSALSPTVMRNSNGSPGAMSLFLDLFRSDETQDITNGDRDDDGDEEISSMDLLPPGARLIAMSHPNFLAPYYPSLDERAVLHHYLHITSHAWIADTSNSHNLWVDTHLALAFSQPRGTSPACDAMQQAVLAIGHTHLKWLTRNGPNQPANPNTNKMRDKALSLVRKANTLPDSIDNLDIILGTLLACMISTSLAGETSWTQTMMTATNIIQQFGGPEQLLARCTPSKRDVFRFVLDQFAIRDVFGCLTTGNAPTFLATGFEPWFLDGTNAADARSSRGTSENMVGITKSMVDLMARICSVVAEKRRLVNSLAANRFFVEMIGEDSGLTEADADDVQAQLALQDRADMLLAEISIWSTTILNSRPVDTRLNFGDTVYLHAIKIHLLTNLYEDPSYQSQILESCLSILSMVSEAGAKYEKLVWLTWPVLVAGMNLSRGQMGLRQTVLKCLNEFENFGCFDNLAAIKVVQDYWVKHDAGMVQSWWDYTSQLGEAQFFD